MNQEQLRQRLHELIDQMDNLEYEQSADIVRLPQPYPEHPKLITFGMSVTIRGYVRKELPKELEQFVQR